MVKKLLKVLLVIMVTFCTLNLTFVKVDAAEKEYEIYPKPHSITYQNGDYVMRDKVNIVYDGTIDAPTKKRLNEVLKSKNKEVSTSNGKVDGKTNIFIGTYGSNGDAEKYAKANYSLESDTFNKFGGHQVISNNGELVIIGKDTDAAFYGITSLKLIFNQIDGSTLRNFVIKDYADTNIRGFIEGYYGIPWSNQDRMSLMKFGGDFKMTAYVFAPKDDPYHTSKWRELYPENELKAIKEMVQVGVDTKCKFVWTAHPFMGGFNASKKDEEIALLLKKFEQLYSVGVRQFGVLGDDVGSLDRAVVIDIMEAVSAWGKEKGDVYDPVFCPAGYNDSWQGDYSELNDYDIGFPKDVQIFWTGEAVCQPVEQKTLTKFKTKNLRDGQPARRNPLFWLNWPVNDINGSRLMMGKGSLLHTDININDLSGVVTNPMQEAEASKVALFAIADYAWNVKNFDDDKSWADSFKYIDEDAGDYLHTLAKHMSNPQPNGHGLVLAESEELKPLINDFKKALADNDSAMIQSTGQQLIKEMDIIIEACDGFRSDSKNTNLLNELKPFIGSLKDLASTIKNYTKSKIALINNDSTTAVNSFTNGTADFNKSKKHVRKMLNGTSMVSPGSTELIPLANKIQETIEDDINKIVNDDSGVLKLTASSSFTSFHDGKIEDIIDGNLSTSAWHNGYEAVGQYFQVNMSIPTSIYGVEIANGTTAKPDDTFGKAKLVYSTDNGKTWQDIDSKLYGDYARTVSLSNIKLDNVTNIRYICTEAGSGDKWPAMREFTVLTTPSTGPIFTSEVIRTTDEWGVYSGNEAQIVDGDDNTGVHYRVRNTNTSNPKDTTLPGDYVGVKLSQSIILGKIHIAQGPDSGSGDYFKDADLEYSLNGTDWTKIATYKNQKVIDVDLSDQDITAQYIRLKNNVSQNTWIGMREIKVEAKVFYNDYAYTNVEAYKSVKANSLDNMGVLAPTQNITLETDQYIGIKLKRIHKLKEIITDITSDKLTIEVSKNGYEWVTVSAGQVTENARYVRLINKTSSAVTFDINNLTVHTDEIEPKKVLSTSGFSAENGLNVLDNDWTSQTIYAGSQNAGKNFVYDLGQTITLNSFKAVCRDSEGDYPRHGKFYVSSDNVTWKEIMTLGNQDSDNPGEKDNTDDINYVLPVHEISYNTKETRNLDEQVRYIKFEITRTKVGADKWVRFQEFVINDGEFLPTENNPTIESTSKETPEGLYKNMLDGNLSTMFIPKENAGSFTYSVSEKNETVNAVKIIQDSNKISNATVKARISTTTRRSQWVDLGTLSQTINEFILPLNATVLDIKVEWKDTQLAISQFNLLTKTDTTVDKTALQNLLDNVENISTWTTSSKAAYEQAIAAGRQVNTGSGSQSSIDSAISLINNAITNKKLKGNTDSLQSVIDDELTQLNKYTASTWKAYSKAIENAKTKMAQKDDLDQITIDALLDAVNKAKADLVFNPTNRESAIITVQDIDMFINSITDPKALYTVNSFKALTDSQKALKDLVDLDKTTSQDPDKFNAAKKAVEDAKTNLVNVKTIPALIKEFDALNKDIYTIESYTVYKDAIDKAKGLLVTGTATSIDAVILEIANAKASLELISISKDDLKAYIKDLEKLLKDDYTQKSYQALETIIKDAKANVDTASNAELGKYAKDLKDAKNNLVSIVSLKAMIEHAKTIDPKNYTTSSYQLLKTEIAKAEKLCIDGSQKDVSACEVSLEKATRNLKVRVNESEATKYIESLKFVNGDAYTKDSYDKYLKAYTVLKDMLNRLDNVSSEEFIQAKEAYDRAYQGLTLSNNHVQTGDSSAMGIFAVLGLLAIGSMLVLRKKKQ